MRKLGVDEWMALTVMITHMEARTVVRTVDGNSEVFGVGVGMHQGSYGKTRHFVRLFVEQRIL